MLKTVKNILKDKSGGMIIWTAGVLLAFCIIAAAATEFYKAYTIAATVEEMVHKTTMTMAVNNTYNAYTALRDAKNNAFETDGMGSWSDIASTVDLTRQMRKLYSFQSKDGKLVNSTSQGVEFMLDIRSVKCGNSLSRSGELEFTVTYTLEIPLRFMREIHVNVPIDNQVSVLFTPLY